MSLRGLFGKFRTIAPIAASIGLPGAGLLSTAVSMGNRVETPGRGLRVPKAFGSAAPQKNIPILGVRNRGAGFPDRRRVAKPTINSGEIIRGGPAFDIPSVFDQPQAVPAVLNNSTQGRARPVMSQLPRVFAGVGPVFSKATGKILSVILPTGQKINKKGMVKMAKEVGLTAAATALGLSVAQLAQVVVDESTKTRRGKGVTAAQLRVTRSTTRRVVGMCKSLGYNVTRGTTTRRRSTKKC